MKDKLFGREPAMYVGAIEAVLALLLSFHLFSLSQSQVGAIMAVVIAVFGVYTAYRTDNTVLSALTTFVKAAVALLAVYGLSATTEQTGALIAVSTVLVSLFQRSQVSPAENPSFSLSTTR